LQWLHRLPTQKPAKKLKATIIWQLMKAIIATVVYYGIMMMEIMLFSAEALPIEKSAPVYFSCFLSNVFFSIFFSFSFFFCGNTPRLGFVGRELNYERNVYAKIAG